MQSSAKTPRIEVRVQAENFDVARELSRLTDGRSNIGAVACFIGLVREFVPDVTSPAVESLTIEHYPEMTRTQLAKTASEACDRWRLDAVTIIHRVGTLRRGENIVFVATAAAHRAPAFEGCEAVMDIVKTEGIFWKRENSAAGSHWVAARADDADRANRWRDK